MTHLSTEDIAAVDARLKAKASRFEASRSPWEPVKLADFDDTCGNLIGLVDG